MIDEGAHSIEDDLQNGWLEELVEAGLAQLEAYLAKHAAFRRYLDGLEA